MLSNRLSNDPHDVLEIAPEVLLGSRADDTDSATLAGGATSRPPDPQIQMDFEPSVDILAPSVDATFRATPIDDVPSENWRTTIGRSAMRTLVGLLLAGGSTAAAVTWQVYGDSAKAVIASLTPRLGVTSSTETPADQPSTPPAQVAATEQAPPQPATPQTTDSAAPAPAASPEQEQSLQSMAHDLAAMRQQIDQLRASIEQLRNGQEQMSREIAKGFETKASEQAARMTVSAIPRPTAAPVRKPRPPAHAPTIAAPRTQAAALPPLRQTTPAQTTPAVAAPLPVEPSPQPATQSDGEPVPRPPMPVR